LDTNTHTTIINYWPTALRMMQDIDFLTNLTNKWKDNLT